LGSDTDTCFLHFATLAVLQTGHGPGRYRLIPIEASAFDYNRDESLEYVFMIYLLTGLGMARRISI